MIFSYIAARMIRNLIIIVLIGLLGGCHPNRSLPPTPQPSPVPTNLSRRIDSALESASKYLVAKQSPDGAWRSEVYGFLKDGPSLTPHVAVLLMQLPKENSRGDAVGDAKRYLQKIPRENLVYAVYTAADMVRLTTGSTRATWLEYLRGHQLDEALGWSIGDVEYGGWSYANRAPMKSHGGGNRGPWDWSNLSATAAAMRALRETGITDADPTVSPALLFAGRCQNVPPEGMEGDKKFEDGGFFFSPAEPIRNKAGDAGVDKFGVKRFNSYGSATVDGMMLLLDCGLEPNHPRIEAAKDWFRTFYNVKYNPGKFVAGNEDLRDATYFYYCRGLARVINRLAWRQWLVKGKSVDVAVTLAEELLSRQREDGSWANSFTDGREDDPLVATPMAAEALLICRTMITTAQEPTTQPTTKPATTQAIAGIRQTAALVISRNALEHGPAHPAADRPGAAAGSRAGDLNLLSHQRGRARRGRRGRRARTLSHRRLERRWAADFDGRRGRQLGRRLPPG
jgi:hypothetical protein